MHPLQKAPKDHHLQRDNLFRIQFPVYWFLSKKRSFWPLSLKQHKYSEEVLIVLCLSFGRRLMSAIFTESNASLLRNKRTFGFKRLITYVE
jgi:hypothetical protein